jgi:hypothetical protein
MLARRFDGAFATVPARKVRGSLEMFDKEISASEVAVGPFPFAHEGEITLSVRNGDYSLWSCDA